MRAFLQVHFAIVQFPANSEHYIFLFPFSNFLALEIAIKQETHLNSLPADQINQWSNALVSIINRGKVVEPNENSYTIDKNEAMSSNRIQGIQDRVASMVRRAAVSKAVRLLDDLDI